MLQYEIARELYEELKEKAAHSSKNGLQDFYKMFLKSAAEYAATRTSWAVMDQASRNEDDRSRRMKHDAFISMLNAVSRNLGIENIDDIVSDRKAKGDFACYIALFLALEQR
jgi:hypothetical protein